MLEDDNEGTGLNIYNPHIEDPYNTNALHSNIRAEIQTLIQRDGEGSVRKVLDRLVKKLPPMGELLS